MTDLPALTQNVPTADPLRQMIYFTTEQLIGPAADAVTGAAYSKKDPARLAQCNGYRDRDGETRAGTAELLTAKIKRASSFPGFLESWHMVKALWP